MGKRENTSGGRVLLALKPGPPKSGPGLFYVMLPLRAPPLSCRAPRTLPGSSGGLHDPLLLALSHLWSPAVQDALLPALQPAVHQSMARRTLCCFPCHGISTWPCWGAATTILPSRL